MTKLNWRDASKELPEAGIVSTKLLCFVVIQFKDRHGELCRVAYYDWYDTDKNEWDINHGEVTHWIYAHELPLPEE